MDLCICPIVSAFFDLLGVPHLPLVMNSSMYIGMCVCIGVESHVPARGVQIVALGSARLFSMCDPVLFSLVSGECCQRF